MKISKKNSGNLVGEQNHSANAVETKQQKSGSDQIYNDDLHEERESGLGFFEGSEFSYEENIFQLYSYYLANMTEQGRSQVEMTGLPPFLID